MIEEVINAGVRTLVVLVLPVTAAAMVVGLVIGTLQSATAIQDTILAYAFKLAAIVAVLYFLFPLYRDSLIKLFTLALQP